MVVRYSVEVKVKSGGTVAQCHNDSKVWWNSGRVAECHSTETCVTVTHCLSVIKICRNSDIGVVNCIGTEWNSGIVVLKCGETMAQ